jgi:hypothetical protein
MYHTALGSENRQTFVPVLKQLDTSFTDSTWTNGVQHRSLDDVLRMEKKAATSAPLFTNQPGGPASVSDGLITLHGDAVVEEIQQHFQDRQTTPAQVKEFLMQRFGVSYLPDTYLVALWIRCHGKSYRIPPTKLGAQCREDMMAVLEENPDDPMPLKDLLKAMEDKARAAGREPLGTGTSGSLFKNSVAALVIGKKIERIKNDKGACLRILPAEASAAKKSAPVLADKAVVRWMQMFPGQTPRVSDINAMLSPDNFHKSVLAAAIQVHFTYQAKLALTPASTATAAASGVKYSDQLLTPVIRFLSQFPANYVVSQEMLMRNLKMDLPAGIMGQLKEANLIRLLLDKPSTWVTTQGPDEWSPQARDRFVQAPARTKSSLQTMVTELLKSIKSWMKTTGCTHIDPATVNDEKIRYFLGRLRTSLMFLRSQGAYASVPTSAALAALGLTLKTLEPVKTLPDFSAELFITLKTKRTISSDSSTQIPPVKHARHSLSKNGVNLEKYLQDLSSDGDIPQFLIKPNSTPPVAYFMTGSVHEPIPAGEDTLLRSQSYLSEMLRLMLGPTGKRMDEIQAQFLHSPCRDAMELPDHIVISSNTKHGADAMVRALGLDPRKATISVLSDGQEIRTWSQIDLCAIARQITPLALAQVPSHQQTDVQRHLLKLNERLPGQIAPEITLHIPVSPKEHAEMVVDKVGHELGLRASGPPSGSREACVGCGAHLHRRKYTVKHVTNLYASNLPDREDLKNLLDANTVVSNRFGSTVDSKGNKHLPFFTRRVSSSPPPEPK